jgi:hypothetical protein
MTGGAHFDAAIHLALYATSEDLSFPYRYEQSRANPTL